MSLGVVVASEEYEFLGERYYLVDPEYQVGGMFSNVLKIKGQKSISLFREDMVADLSGFLEELDADRIFAYNAKFDYNMMPELSDYLWYDIMRLAAYRQYNPKIPNNAPCYGTGRMKNGYGVEEIFRMLSGNGRYFEKHNALCDAEDELSIMKLLGHILEMYEVARIN